MDGRWEELRRYVGFDAADAARLAEAWPRIEPGLEGVLDRFYARVTASDETRRVITDDAQLVRLRSTLRVWLRELMLGPHDDAYVERRLRIGRRHVEVGLDSRFMYAAMQVVEDAVADLLVDALPIERVWPIVASLRRAMTVDLAVMTSSYVREREHRTAEALQALLVLHLRGSVLLVDADGRVTAATRQSAKTLGAPPVIGRPWEEAVPAAIRTAGQLEDNVRHALERDVEVTVPRIDLPGEAPRSFRAHLVPIEHPAARLMIQIEDLTEAVGLESRLRRAEALAQLGSLSASVAHELRNPLAGISGAVQVIARSVPDSTPYAPVLALVEREIHRLDELVTELLAFSDPGAARLQPVDLAVPVGRALERFRAANPDVAFTVSGAGSAIADPELVHQIVVNLLQNAVQAIAGRGTVAVTVRDGEIVVSDDGPGVPSPLAGRVFEPFFTTKTRGTGLGLAIGHRFAQSMGGALVLRRSGSLKGATFAVELPVDR
ncbi:MAG: protoglobin domain-containing protein [Myxococcota bacterium]